MRRLPGWTELRARSDLLAALVLATIALAIVAGVALFVATRGQHGTMPDWRPGAAFSGPQQPAAPPAPAEATLAAGLRFLTVSPDRARALNATIPLSTLPNPPAPPFALGGADTLAQVRATDCLAAAIAFTAGADGPGAERAVAQVVLNRVRHFAYPKSVCGTVFDRLPDGRCQFAFACDGSLTRPPAPAVWDRARAVAAAALAGAVDAKVGLATHFHPDTLVPVPDSALIKTAVIGRWIFYRGAGPWSAPAAFTDYGGTEPDEPQMAPLWSDDLAAATAVAPLAPADAGAAPTAVTTRPPESPAPAAAIPAPPVEPARIASPAPAAAAVPPLALPAPAAPPSDPPARKPATPARKIPTEPTIRRLPIAGG